MATEITLDEVLKATGKEKIRLNQIWGKNRIKDLFTEHIVTSILVVIDSVATSGLSANIKVLCV